MDRAINTPVAPHIDRGAFLRADSIAYYYSIKNAALWQRDKTIPNHTRQFTEIRHGLTLSALILFMAAFFPFWANAQTTTPEQMTLNFYKKYMIQCAKDFGPPSGNINRDYFCNIDIQKYITKSLYEKIMRSQRAQPIGDLLPDTDPNYLGDSDYFTHTQDFAAEWASLISVKKIRGDNNKAVVRVFMASSGPVNNAHAVCVRLQRDKNSWKINLVDLAPENLLPSCTDN